MQNTVIALNVNTCKFFINMYYPEHAAHPSKLEIPSHTTDQIQVLETLKNAFQFKSLLGSCNVYCILILNFTKIQSTFYHRIENGELDNYGPLEEKREKILHWPL